MLEQLSEGLAAKTFIHDANVLRSAVLAAAKKFSDEDKRRQRAEKDTFGAHPKWRRLTGLTFSWEKNVSRKERRRGLKRLVRWVKRATAGSGSGGAAPDADTSGGTHDTRRATGGTRTALRATGETTCRAVQIRTWARVQAEGVSVEALCARLELSRARLSTLTKEYCGLTAGELIDGFKIERVRRGLGERLRAAARELWGIPGVYALTKIERVHFERRGAIGDCRLPIGDCPADETRAGWPGPTGRVSRSETRSPNSAPPDQRLGDFCEAPADEFEPRSKRTATRSSAAPAGFLSPAATRPAGSGHPEFCETRAEEHARRVEELAKKIHEDFEIDAWAIQLGFATPARLKRACLNVLGKTLRQLERALADEVVRFYRAAEDKHLRELASGEDSRAQTILARELYGRSDKKPEPPFMDEWSKWEELAPDWLKLMCEEFG